MFILGVGGEINMHPISEPLHTLEQGISKLFIYVSQEPNTLNICLASTEILINISII